MISHANKHNIYLACDWDSSAGPALRQDVVKGPPVEGLGRAVGVAELVHLWAFIDWVAWGRASMGVYRGVYCDGDAEKRSLSAHERGNGYVPLFGFKTQYEWHVCISVGTFFSPRHE